MVVDLVVADLAGVDLVVVGLVVVGLAVVGLAVVDLVVVDLVVVVSWDQVVAAWLDRLVESWQLVASCQRVAVVVEPWLRW